MNDIKINATAEFIQYAVPINPSLDINTYTNSPPISILINNQMQNADIDESIEHIESIQSIESSQISIRNKRTYRNNHVNCIWCKNICIISISLIIASIIIHNIT
jgi:hypothetical protein